MRGDPSPPRRAWRATEVSLKEVSGPPLQSGGGSRLIIPWELYNKPDSQEFGEEKTGESQHTKGKGGNIVISSLSTFC